MNEWRTIVRCDIFCLGHDFRRDYSQLGKSFKHSHLEILFILLIKGQLRLNYPQVNMTLLTATATPRVQQDILQQLNITGNYKLFLQSFNRPNLIYECIAKENTDLTLNQIANLIKINYENQSGIIYCFSRAECDRTGKSKLNQSLNKFFSFSTIFIGTQHPCIILSCWSERFITTNRAYAMDTR